MRQNHEKSLEKEPEEVVLEPIDTDELARLAKNFLTKR